MDSSERIKGKRIRSALPLSLTVGLSLSLHPLWLFHWRVCSRLIWPGFHTDGGREGDLHVQPIDQLRQWEEEDGKSLFSSFCSFSLQLLLIAEHEERRGGEGSGILK